MTQEQIIALDSKKHIKIWLLHKQGLTRRQIADLLGTNPGHVGNEIKAYTVNKEKREAAEAINNTNDDKNGNKKETNEDKKSIRAIVLYLRASIGAAKKKQPGGLSKGEIKDLENKLVLEFATKNNLFIDSISKLPDPIGGGGNENSLYYEEKTETIYKQNNLFNYSDSILNFLEYILVYNDLFPKIKYSLFGFIGNRNIEPIVSQKYIIGGHPTETELRSHMEKEGFEKIGDYTYKKEQYVVSDVRERNAIKSSDGEIYVIDNIIREEKKVEESDYQKASKIPKSQNENSPVPLSKLKKENVYYLKGKIQGWGWRYGTAFIFKGQMDSNYIFLPKKYEKTHPDAYLTVTPYKLESAYFVPKQELMMEVVNEINNKYNDSFDIEEIAGYIEKTKTLSVYGGSKQTHEWHEGQDTRIDDTFIVNLLKSKGIQYDREVEEYNPGSEKGWRVLSRAYRYKIKSIPETKSSNQLGEGGILEGPKHGSGGIKATLPDGNPIELEGGEIIINAKAAKENCKELSKINQSAGNGVAFPCNNPALDGIQGPMAGEGAKIEAEHEDLYNELASLIPGGMPLSKEAFFEKIAKKHIKENPDYYKKLEEYVEPKADFSKKPYYLLTKEETIAERDRLEANNTNPQRLQDLCRYSYTKFKTLLKDLK